MKTVASSSSKNKFECLQPEALSSWAHPSCAVATINFIVTDSVCPTRVNVHFGTQKFIDWCHGTHTCTHTKHWMNGWRWIFLCACSLFMRIATVPYRHTLNSMVSWCRNFVWIRITFAEKKRKKKRDQTRINATSSVFSVRMDSLQINNTRTSHCWLFFINIVALVVVDATPLLVPSVCLTFLRSLVRYSHTHTALLALRSPENDNNNKYIIHKWCLY